MLRLRTPSAPVAVLFAVGVAQSADLVTFLRMIREYGPQAEANPLVAVAAAAGAFLPLVLAKVGLVALVVGVFTLAMRGHPRMGAIGALVATLAVGAGLLGAFSNVNVLLGAAAIRIVLPVPI